MDHTASASRRPIQTILRSGSYRFLVSAGAMVNTGMWAWMLASSYLVYQLTHSPLLTQLNGVAFTVPNLIFGLFSSVLADSFERRRLLQVSYVVNAVAACIVATLVLISRIEVWQVICATLAIGSVNTLDWSARWTLASNVVERRFIPYAMALESASLTSGQFVGPWLTGSLVSSAPIGQSGGAASLMAIAAFFLIAALLLARVVPLVRQEFVQLSLRTSWARTAEGLRAAAGNRVVIRTLGVAVLVNVFFYSYAPLVPAFAEDVLRVNPTLMGLLGGAQGLGALLGATFIASRNEIRRNSDYFVAGSLMTLVGLLAFSMSRSYSISLGSLIFAGIGLGGFSSMLTTLTLVWVSDEMRGRATGIINLAVGAWPLGMLLVGGLAEWFGPSIAVRCTSATGRRNGSEGAPCNHARASQHPS